MCNTLESLANPTRPGSWGHNVVSCCRAVAAAISRPGGSMGLSCPLYYRGRNLSSPLYENCTAICNWPADYNLHRSSYFAARWQHAGAANRSRRRSGQFCFSLAAPSSVSLSAISLAATFREVGLGVSFYFYFHLLPLNTPPPISRISLVCPPLGGLQPSYGSWILETRRSGRCRVSLHNCFELVPGYWAIPQSSNHSVALPGMY